MNDAGGGGGGGGGCCCCCEAQIHRNSPGSSSSSSSRRGGSKESGFALASLHHNPGSGGCCFSSSRQHAGKGSPVSQRVRGGRSGSDGRKHHQERQEGEGIRRMPAGGADQSQARAAAAAAAHVACSPGCNDASGGVVLLSPRRPPRRARRGVGPLLRWDEVPEDFVECFILSGYRRLHCTAQECVASVLQPTNETLNFWTHFVPLLLFAGKFGRLLLLRGGGGGGGADDAVDLPLHHAALLPLWCYASGVLLTFAMSCTAHVFSCISLRLRAAFFYLDYASISYYGFASTVAYYYYLLPGLSLLEPGALSRYLQQRLGWHVDCRAPIAAYSALVLPVAFALAVACTVACCKSRSEWCAYPFAIRTFVFVMPLSMACPIMIESLLFDLQGHNPTLFVHFYRRYFWLLVAAFFNVSKIPERFQPGLFDIIGHSHQLFHIFTFLSIYDQMFYVEEGLRHFLRDPPPTQPTFAGTVGYMLLLILCLALVVRKYLNASGTLKDD